MKNNAGRSHPARSLAGIMKTSTCMLHVTDREGCLQTSTCVPHVTDRQVLNRGASSGSQGRMELRLKIEQSLAEARTVLALLVVGGVGGIWREHATWSMLWMLWGMVTSFQRVGTGEDVLLDGMFRPRQSSNRTATSSANRRLHSCYFCRSRRKKQIEEHAKTRRLTSI